MGRSLHQVTVHAIGWIYYVKPRRSSSVFVVVQATLKSGTYWVQTICFITVRANFDGTRKRGFYYTSSRYDTV